MRTLCSRRARSSLSNPVPQITRSWRPIDRVVSEPDRHALRGRAPAPSARTVPGSIRHSCGAAAACGRAASCSHPGGDYAGTRRCASFAQGPPAPPVTRGQGGDRATRIRPPGATGLLFGEVVNPTPSIPPVCGRRWFDSPIDQLWLIVASRFWPFASDTPPAGAPRPADRHRGAAQHGATTPSRSWLGGLARSLSTCARTLRGAGPGVAFPHADIFQQAARAVEALSDQCRASAYRLRPPSANTLTPLAEGQIGGDDGRAPSCQFEDLLLGDPVHGTSVDLAEGLQVRKARFAQPPRGGAWLRGRGPRRPGAVAEQGGS